MPTKKSYSSVIIALFVLMFSLQYGCDKEKKTPVVTTKEVTNITPTSAICGGEVVSDEGLAVSFRGVCWNTEKDPTVADNKTIDGSGAGSFTSQISGLVPNTRYFARAYATNEEGTAYGSSMIFIAQNTNPTVTDIDGNLYHTVTIGDQVWMVENLRTTKYRNGEAVPLVTDDTQWNGLTTGAYCTYNNDANIGNTYGLLYNWFAVMDARKIAPTGWRVSMDADWLKLVAFLGGEGIAGGKLKEVGTAHWHAPNTQATDDFGFCGLPGGGRAPAGNYGELGKNATFWTSLPQGPDGAYGWSLINTSSLAEKVAFYKRSGISVRCIKE
jgi:uncharacterized protein (TIGR02145 family)